jgi:hypothetical protein
VIIIPVQVELLKVKVSQQFVFSGAADCTIIIPSTSRGVESKSIPTVYLLHSRTIIIPRTSRIVE